MKRRDVYDAYSNHFNWTLGTLFALRDTPVEARAEGCYIWDDKGVRYLDCATAFGTLGVGHANPRVQAAVLRQLETMATAPGLVYHAPAAELMRKLAALLPEDLCRVFPSGSGSEAIEIALRTALLARPGRTRLVSVATGYHGKTLGALSIFAGESSRLPFAPLHEDVRFIPFMDVAAAREAIGQGAAALILEPVVGGGHLTVPPTSYLQELRALCDQTGTLLVLDEVQTGFGRTGKMFAFEHSGIVPDILVSSKMITGGHVPMAVTVVRDRVLREIDERHGPEAQAFWTDTGGSPIACVAAATAIDIIVEEKLAERAATLGPRLLAGLRRIAEQYPELVLDAPGIGLMTGLKMHSVVFKAALSMALLRHGVIGGISGSDLKHPVLRFYPPLVITAEQIDVLIGALEASLKALSRCPTRVYDFANQAVKVVPYLPGQWMRGLGHMIFGN